jgi:hypothetical protein
MQYNKKKEPPTISDNPKSPTICQKSYEPAIGFHLELTYDFVDRLQKNTLIAKAASLKLRI